MSSPADVRERTRIEPGYEIVDGVCVEKDMGYKGDVIATIVSTFFVEQLQRTGLGVVASQGGGFQYPALDQGKLHFPDVSFVRGERLPEDLPDGWANFPPDLVVEVVSPNDDAEAVQAKAKMWLEGGARMVWVVYPRSRTINVFRPGGEARVLDEQDTLTGEDVVPGFSVPVVEIFAVPNTKKA